MKKTGMSRNAGFWMVSGAALLWGTIGVATQGIYNSDNTTSLFINLGRNMIATPLLLWVAWHQVGRRLFHIEKRDTFLMFLQGTLLALSHAAYFASIRLAGVSIATLITICIAPVIVSLLSVALKLEQMNRRLLLALVLAISGTVLLVGFGNPAGESKDLLAGSLFAVGAAFAYGSTLVTGRFLAARYSALQINAISFSFGTIVLLVINLFTSFTPIQSTAGWLLLVYLGLIPTALAYWLFQMGLRSVSATAASILGILDPLVAAFLAWLLFGESLAATGVIGALLLIVSIFLLSMEKDPSE
jgi:DME family drug/metabolite transporter